jgi:hypothetical protein
MKRIDETSELFGKDHALDHAELIRKTKKLQNIIILVNLFKI